MSCSLDVINPHGAEVECDICERVLVALDMRCKPLVTVRAMQSASCRGQTEENEPWFGSIP